MKKIIFSVLCTFFFILVQAQVRVGVIAGLHSSKLNSLKDIGLNSTSFTLFHGGVVVDLRMPSSKYFLQGQVLYTSFGYRESNILAVDEEGNDIGDIGSEKIGYLQIPAYIGYAFDVSSIKLKLGAGPYVAFKTNETMKIAQGDTFRNTVFPAGTNGPSSVLMGGGVFGALELPNFFIAVQYQHSFSNIYENSHNSPTKWKVNTIGFSLGFFLK